MQQTVSDIESRLTMEQTLISPYNSLGDGRYFDTTSQTSFEVDHASQVCAGDRPRPALRLDVI
jgi:hypothetical protein